MADGLISEYILGIAVSHMELTVVILDSQSEVYSSHSVKLGYLTDLCVLTAMDTVIASLSIPIDIIIITCQSQGLLWAIKSQLMRSDKDWYSNATVIGFPEVLTKIIQSDPRYRDYASVIFLGVDVQGNLADYESISIVDTASGKTIKSVNPWIFSYKGIGNTQPSILTDKGRRVIKQSLASIPELEKFSAVLYCYGVGAVDEDKVVNLGEFLDFPAYILPIQGIDDPKFTMAYGASLYGNNRLDMENSLEKKPFPLGLIAMILIALTVVVTGTEGLLGTLRHDKLDYSNDRRSGKNTYQLIISTVPAPRASHTRKTYNPSVVTQEILGPKDTSTTSEEDVDTETSNDHHSSESSTNSSA